MASHGPPFGLDLGGARDGEGIMSGGAQPWSVKGIDPRAREAAREMARRQGMTLGEWLNHAILMQDAPATDAEEGEPPSSVLMLEDGDGPAQEAWTLATQGVGKGRSDPLSMTGG
jgi:hypothetical protein